MPWEQEESVVQAAMETLQETHGSSHTAMLGNDGAGPSNTTQTPSNQWQLQLQAEITKREAVEHHLKRVEDELNHVKGLVATMLESSPHYSKRRTKPAPTLTKRRTKPPPTLTKRRTKPATRSNPAAHSNPHCGLAKLTIQGCEERQTCQKEGQGSHGGLGKLTIKAGQ
jgi:hypothetical protein